jgi:hypothetical protein
LWVKIAYTAFCAVLIPIYLRDYGPTNFLYFCDVALLMTLVAVWTERPIWATMPAVGILLPQTLWMVDFLIESVGYFTKRDIHLTGMTGYMFNQGIPLFARLLSLFHFWLPIVLVWLVARLGYDRRALARWTLLAWALLLTCYFLMPPPPAPADDPNLPVNINYVHGFSSTGPQTMMPPLAYLGLVMFVLPAFIFLPTHLGLKWMWGRGKTTVEQ